MQGHRNSGHKDQPRGLWARDPPFAPTTNQHPNVLILWPYRRVSQRHERGAPFQNDRDPNQKTPHLRSSIVLVEVLHRNVGPVEGAVTVGGAHPLQFILGREARRGGNSCFWPPGTDGVPPKLGFPVPVHVSGECRPWRPSWEPCTFIPGRGKRPS